MRPYGYSSYEGGNKDSFSFWYRSIVLILLPLTLTGVMGVVYQLYALSLDSANMRRDLLELRTDLADLPQLRKDVDRIKYRQDFNSKWIDEEIVLHTNKREH